MKLGPVCSPARPRPPRSCAESPGRCTPTAGPRHGQRRCAQATELARARLDRRRRAVLEHVTVRAHVVERGAVAL